MFTSFSSKFHVSVTNISIALINNIRVDRHRQWAVATDSSNVFSPPSSQEQQLYAQINFLRGLRLRQRGPPRGARRADRRSGIEDARSEVMGVGERNPIKRSFP
ncbi:hypothetical protein AVEN_37166-1 [Araneus ventricosus]|uniref:Uncharacterized protein n=1 Tax=Araneus ventricosus TaxID=182803 RepID=A0A4Y2QUW7_ARAVE|nr:hypothetical protein AVEN_37166-1 [Araneus ventricosus]